MSTDWRKKEIAHWPQCVPPFGGRTIPEGGKGSGRFSCPPTVSTTSTDSMNERSLSFLRWGARRQGSDTAAPPVPVLSWKDCGVTFGESFQCATARVPLDYGRPTGRSISISLVRHLAGVPAQRVGSLLVNPGGPGDSGILFLRNGL